MKEYSIVDLQKIVSDNIARIMAKGNYSTYDIQKITGYNMSAQQLNNILRGTSFVSAKSIVLLCNAFGVQPAQLFEERA